MPALFSWQTRTSPIAVDHQPGQAVGLGVDQAVERPLEQPLAQAQRPREAALEEGRIDRRVGVAGRAAAPRSGSAG